MGEQIKKLGMLILIFALALSLSACSSFSSKPKTNMDTKYYQGYKGVEMQFSESLPPDRIYYYGDSEDNTFDVNLEVANKGSSWSRGGIFLSGYDPQMIEIDGITPDPSKSRACRLSIGNIGFGKFGGTLSCESFFLGAGEGGYFEIGKQDMFCPGGSHAGTFDIQRLYGGSGCMDAWFRSSGGDNWKGSIGWSNPDIDVEYANHGRLLIAMLQSVDFTRTYGIEYLLAGNNYEYPGGETRYVNFRGNVYAWPPGLDKTDQTFLVTNCYMYATYAAPVVCIDPSPFSESRKVCTPQAYSGTSGQGAPVAVNYIEQENTPRQAVFTIHIKNTGGGRVYNPGMLEVCSPYSPVRITSNELNVVFIGDIRVSGDLQRLECTPNDFVRLDPKTGEGIVTCSYDIPYSGLKSAYKAPLVVELWYGYEKTIEKRVSIKRAI
jgi:hypothetical protein